MQRAGSVSITVQPGLGVCHPALISVRSFRGNLPTPAGNAKLARSIPKIRPIVAGAAWPENCLRWSRSCAEKHGLLPGRTFKIWVMLITLSWLPADFQILLKGDLHHMAAASRYRAPGAARAAARMGHGGTAPTVAGLVENHRPLIRPRGAQGEATRRWGISPRQIKSQRNR